MEKGDAIKKILDRLEKEPATPKELEDDLGMAHSTINHVLHRSIVARIGLFKQLDNGKYAVKWYSSEEHDVRNGYNLLKRKLLRPPTPEELASYIKRRPAEARDLLFKYVKGYHEPRDEEVVLAANNLWKMVICSAWLEKGLPTSKRYWFDRSIKRVVIDGIDNETIHGLLKDKFSNNPAEFRDYFKHFPEMKPDITIAENEYECNYGVVWTDDLKNSIHPILPWKQTAEITIPLKYGGSGIKFAAVNELGFDCVTEIAELYSLSPKLMDDLLCLIGITWDNEGLLEALMKFCQNGMEVEQLTREAKDKIVSALIKIAFDLDRSGEGTPRVSHKERELAFGIIAELNVREGPGFETAKRYFFETLYQGRFSNANGPHLHKVGKWLADDPGTRAQLIKMIEEIISKQQDEICVYNNNRFLEYFLSLNSM
jgi:hypothetical protein